MKLQGWSRIFALMTGLLLGGALSAGGPKPLGVFGDHGDIGKVKHAGSAAFDAKDGSYVLKASGTNMWGKSDEFHFVWKKLKGDFILQAQAEFLGKGADPHRKLGLIVRQSLDPASPDLTVVRHGDGLTAMQFRRSPGSEVEEVRARVEGADVLQLERKGDVCTMSVARFGETYSHSQLQIPLGEEVYVGLFLCAHNPEVVEGARFHNVRLVKPFKDSYVRYHDYIGSDVELLDVNTGARKVVHHEQDSIQAPNWTPDGKALILNRNGRIYRFDLAAKKIAEVNTGAQIQNNNDHALSFDGKQMGISSGSPSRVYAVPATGGEPTLITPTGPSYFHGWSPDGKWMSFTGERGGNYDVYLVPAGGGPERRLTTAQGLDDGSEFTPDGQWIYFNSVRTGRMQVWRMKPDGSEQQQLTFDDFNNWFPHISPDGKSIVMITYGTDVEAGDHPFYQRVYLRKMPLEGGKPSVIAYVYGGQGSLNVNSWSPDNKTVAFVSNSDVFETVKP